jgi:ketosteroid isomerase-like protein
MTTPPETDAIRRLVSRVNDAWLKGSAEEISATLDRCFAEEMVIWGPDCREAARGKEACVKSYVDFASQAVVKHCTLADPTVHRVGDTAIASYSWDMTYLLSNREYFDTGHDVLVLNRARGEWRIVWRMILPSSPQGG